MGERRRERREPVTLVVDYDDADDLVSDYTENLSSGGTFLYTERVLDKGTRVDLRLSFPGLLKPIEIAGEVRWCRRGSDPGVGIEFYEPDRLANEEKLNQILEAVRSQDPRYVAQLHRILVVDDNQHVAGLIRDGISLGFRNLADRVFHVRMRHTAEGALNLLRDTPFHALISELHLPDAGDAFLRMLRKDSQVGHLPVLAISSGDGAEQVALDYGADLFLPKPVRLRQIVGALTKLLRLPGAN